VKGTIVIAEDIILRFREMLAKGSRDASDDELREFVQLRD
jgi:hypothetical protein